MSTDDQNRWDAQHRTSHGSDQAAPLLREILASAAWPALGGQALDIACGKGRNAIYLAERGFSVTALDISAVALAEGRRRAELSGLEIRWRQCDLESAALDLGAFDLVINFNYLQRSLFPALVQAVKPGGHVIFETFTIDQAALGPPKNRDYLLRHNELLERFGEFRVLFYREGLSLDGGAPAHRAGIYARRVR